MQYTADNIKVLSDIQHMQQRAGMYIGEAIDPRQLLSEIFDNAVDEDQAGFSSELVVEIDTKSNIYKVRDFGRGIPHGEKTLEDGTKLEVLEVLVTKANSGGKFDNSSYNYSSGLNGLGLTITNALSNFIDITSYRKDKFVSIHSEAGENNNLTKGKTTEPDGTLVVFSPKKDFFHNEHIPVDFIANRCKIASALGFRARLIVDGVEQKTTSTMFDLITEDDSKINIYHDFDVIEVENDAKEKMKVALRYTSDTKDRYFGYTNLLNNTMGGTHVQVLSKTIIEGWKEFIDTHKNIKPAIDLKDNDYLVGLRGVCAVFISKPEFSSQTKEKLVVNKKYFDDLMLKYKKQFKKYLEEHIDIANQLVKRFEEYRISQNALLSRKEISSLIKVNNDTGDNIRRRSIVSKLRECTSQKRQGTELFIVEGDSAMGPYLNVRNKELQAVLPLRGKILNVTGKEVKECVKNSEVCDIANSIGCGIGAACDASKSRYDKVIISADADPDGLQINCLVLSLFINMFPDMVKQGRVYVSLPPLYCWGDNPSNYGWCSDVKDIPDDIKEVHRFKGLGEMNDPELYYFLVDPNTRRVMQIDYPSDIDRFNKILGTSEGKNQLMKDLGIVEGTLEEN